MSAFTSFLHSSVDSSFFQKLSVVFTAIALASALQGCIVLGGWTTDKDIVEVGDKERVKTTQSINGFEFNLRLPTADNILPYEFRIGDGTESKTTLVTTEKIINNSK